MDITKPLPRHFEESTTTPLPTVPTTVPGQNAHEAHEAHQASVPGIHLARLRLFRKPEVVPEYATNWHPRMKSADAIKQLKAGLVQSKPMFEIGDYWCTASKKRGMFVVEYVARSGSIEKMRFPIAGSAEAFKNFTDDLAKSAVAAKIAAKNAINAKDYLSMQNGIEFYKDEATALRALSTNAMPGRCVTRLSENKEQIVISYIDIDGVKKDKTFDSTDIPEKELVLVEGVNVDARTLSSPQKFIDSVQEKGPAYCRDRDNLVAQGRYPDYDVFSEISRKFADTLKDHGFKGLFCFDAALARAAINGPGSCSIRLTSADTLATYGRLFFSYPDRTIGEVTVHRDGYVVKTEYQEEMPITKFLDTKWKSQ